MILLRIEIVFQHCETFPSIEFLIGSDKANFYSDGNNLSNNFNNFTSVQYFVVFSAETEV